MILHGEAAHVSMAADYCKVVLVEVLVVTKEVFEGAVLSKIEHLIIFTFLCFEPKVY